ncbi:DUF6286 domain-containing protein [Streptomyces sp. NPDC059828]|uniref:DUF6286 domain-containing protein n=1 Tax=Streptomyces sp. NPDC059828 TaxID=3346965 RepID=UPI0036483C26
MLLFSAGMSLFGISRVQAGYPAAPWHEHLFDELATRPLDDAWMLIGAMVAAALGLWLLVLALTPGMRRQLPLQVAAEGEHTRVVLDRDGAAQLLRDSAMRVPGVSQAKVRVYRHRVKVRADVRFRDPRDVKDELLTAIRDEQRDKLALARLPKLAVRTRRPA